MLAHDNYVKTLQNCIISDGHHFPTFLNKTSRDKNEV